MKKSLKLILLSSVLSLGALTACNNGPKDGKIHVVFWHTMGQSNQDILDRMIKEFEADNPDIVVEAYSQGGYDEIADKIGSAIPAGTTPTMSFCYPDNVASYIAAGAVEDMTSYVNNPEYGFGEDDSQSDFIDAYWKEGTDYQDAGVYSVPYAKSTEVIFYNKTAFEQYNWEVPTTWDEMWTLCRTMKAAGVRYPLGYDSDSNLFITMCEQEGIPYTSKNGDHYLFNNDQAKAMVSDLKSKFDEGLFLTKGSQPNNTYTSTLFTQMDIMMSIGSTGGTSYNNSLNFEVGVAPIPGGTLNDHVISQGPSICFFRRAGQDEKIAAWKFYKHITNAVNSASFAIRTGYEPVRTSSFETPEYLNYISQASNNLLARAAICTKANYQERYFSSAVFDGSDVARDAVGGIIANVLLNTKTINAAFDEAITQCII